MDSVTAIALDHRPWVVLVGGFLAAGKTTLILAAAQELKRRGLKCAVILNDQGDDLVDTRYALSQEMQADEVRGGCFCCRLSDLVDTLNSLLAHSPAVIFAEPVGSCTDLSATVYHPLLDYKSRFRLAPLSVLVDPGRLQALAEHADENLEFLFRKQIEEADLVVFTKADMYPTAPSLKAAATRQVSAKTAQGVAAWIDEVLSGELEGGTHLLDIDYERYAAAEAALAWLNLRAMFRPTNPMSPALVLGPLTDAIEASIEGAGMEIVHLKALVECSEGLIKVAVSGRGNRKSVEGALTAYPAEEHELRLNIRAAGSAERLREIVERHLHMLDGELSGIRLQCFQPAAPKPQRRNAKRNF
jgi:Ni2+-binding GTPase involved in maturation of urease and hydrogenase